jgi:hypothetical protein
MINTIPYLSRRFLPPLYELLHPLKDSYIPSSRLTNPLLFPVSPTSSTYRTTYHIPLRTPTPHYEHLHPFVIPHLKRLPSTRTISHHTTSITYRPILNKKGTTSRPKMNYTQYQPHQPTYRSLHPKIISTRPVL